MKQIIGFVLAVLFVGVSLIILIEAVGRETNYSLASSSASQVSRELGAELRTAQRSTNDEVSRVQGLARAEYDNKLGTARLNEANANARKTNAEAQRLEDESVKDAFGGWGLGWQKLMNTGAPQSAGLGLLCCAGAVLIGAVVLGFNLGTKSRG